MEHEHPKIQQLFNDIEKFHQSSCSLGEVEVHHDHEKVVDSDDNDNDDINNNIATADAAVDNHHVEISHSRYLLDKQSIHHHRHSSSSSSLNNNFATRSYSISSASSSSSSGSIDGTVTNNSQEDLLSMKAVLGDYHDNYHDLSQDIIAHDHHSLRPNSSSSSSSGTISGINKASNNSGRTSSFVGVGGVGNREILVDVDKYDRQAVYNQAYRAYQKSRDENYHHNDHRNIIRKSPNSFFFSLEKSDKNSRGSSNNISSNSSSMMYIKGKKREVKNLVSSRQSDRGLYNNSYDGIGIKDHHNDLGYSIISSSGGDSEKGIMIPSVSTSTSSSSSSSLVTTGSKLKRRSKTKKANNVI